MQGTHGRHYTYSPRVILHRVWPPSRRWAKTPRNTHSNPLAQNRVATPCDAGYLRGMTRVQPIVTLLCVGKPRRLRDIDHSEGWGYVR